MFRIARQAKESRNPDLWVGMRAAYVPGLTGYTGAKLPDLAPGGQGQATMTNMDPYTDWGADATGPYIDLDGTNDYLDIPNPGRTALMIVPISILARVNLRTAQVSRQFLCNAASPVTGGFGFGIDDSTNNKIKWSTITTGGTITTLISNTALTSNTWATVGVSYYPTAGAEANKKVYINGVLDNTQNTTNLLGQTYTMPNASIGRYPGGGSQFLNGFWSHIIVWNRILTTDEWLRLAIDASAPWRPRHVRPQAYEQPQIDLIAKRRRRKGDQTEPVPWWTW